MMDDLFSKEATNKCHRNYLLLLPHANALKARARKILCVDEISLYVDHHLSEGQIKSIAHVIYENLQLAFDHRRKKLSLMGISAKEQKPLEEFLREVAQPNWKFVVRENTIDFSLNIEKIVEKRV